MTETETETFVSQDQIFWHWYRKFFRDQIFWNQYQNLFSETKFPKTQTGILETKTEPEIKTETFECLWQILEMYEGDLP